MPRFVSVLLCLSYCLLCLPTTFAAPALGSAGLIKRQDDAPVTVVTENTIPGPSGPVTETCTITLTPITVDGQPNFLEQQSCTQTPASSNNSNTPPSPSAPPIESNSSTQQVNSATATDAPSSSDSATPTDSTVPASQSSSPAVPTSGPVAPTDVSVIGASLATTIPSVTQTTSPSSSAATVSSVATSAAAAPTDVAVLGPSSMPTASAAAILKPSLSSSTSSPTASAASNFAIPGKSIQVLPIGLGIFAGVSVIALIVVGLVTYERTKYRRKFRKDKLAESAAPMGFGGMAERL